VSKAGYGDRLTVQVLPSRGTGNWTFRVQRRNSSGSWQSLPTPYRTEGTGETRTISLGPGTYRVVVPDQHGFLGATSSPVALTKPTVRVKASTDRAKDRIIIDVDPNKGAGYWSFRVQRKSPTGTWATLGTYRTQGSAETRTIDVRRGTYRVVVSGKYGYLGATSTSVSITR
jgi:hypothetical protein